MIKQIIQSRKKRFKAGGRTTTAVIAIGIVTILGVYVLYAGYATMVSISREPETGTVIPPAVNVNDATASAGKALKFGGAANPDDLTDVPYGSHPQQNMDIHPSTDGQVRPAIIMVHGGGWQGGSKGNLDTESRQLAANGFTVFNINYRLPGEGEAGYPMEVDDVKAAARWVVANGANYRADPLDLHLIGGSAGGHLAAISGGMLNIEKPGMILSVSSLSGAMDFTVPYDPAEDGGAIGVQNLLGCDPVTECSRELLAEASPVSYVGPHSPPIYLMHSLDEQADQRQAQSMHDRMLAADKEVKLRWLPGTEHAFQFWDTVDVSVVKWINSH